MPAVLNPSSTRRQCPNGCDAEPQRGVILCRGCKKKLEGYLADCEALRQQLMITLTRQDVIGPAAEGRSKKVEKDIIEHPEGDYVSDQWLRTRPYNFAASHALDALKATLTSWTRLIAKEIGEEGPAETIAALSSWLAIRTDYLVRHEAAAKLFTQMRSVTRRASSAIDLPHDRSKVHVGPCPELEPDENGNMVPCLGEITAYFPIDTDLRPVMMCLHSGCTHGEKIWPAEQWARLGRRIIERKGDTITWDATAMQRLAESIA